MKSEGEIVDILAAYDLTGSLRAAAQLAGCDHHTVARYVALRDAGQPPPTRARRDRAMDAWRDKLVELVEQSRGHVRADIAHRKLTTMGYGGSERTTRREVADAKRAYRAGHRRVFKPWIPEPGKWLQFDWGDGPMVKERSTSLWCAWLALSCFRVVIPTWDRTEATLIACLDATFRVLDDLPGKEPSDVLRRGERDRADRGDRHAGDEGGTSADAVGDPAERQHGGDQRRHVDAEEQRHRRRAKW